MITDYADSSLWQRRVTSLWQAGRGRHGEGVRVRVGPHYSGVRPKGCPHKFQHIAEQNIIGSARIVCLCFSMCHLHNPLSTIYNRHPQV